MKPSHEIEPSALPSTPGDAPAPLGNAPSYDAVLDTALQFTFPGSDPISVEEFCRRLAAQEHPR